MTVPHFPGTTTDIGKLRSLQSCVDEAGFFSILAFDHPASFILGAPSDDEPTDEQFRQAVEAKVQLAFEMAPLCSAVLTDPDMGLAPIIAGGALPGSVGLMLNIESEGYQVVADARRITEVRPGWSAAKIRSAGGDGLKLLWRYRHDVPEAAAHRELVTRLAADCAAASLPLVVEPIWVALPGEDLTDPAVRAARVRGVVEYARLAQELGADIVKTEFPGWVDTADQRDAGAEACAELDAGLDVPWLLLSAGVTFEQFLAQTEIAAKAGASGFIAGRAVWDAAASPDPAVRDAGIGEAIERLQRLTAVVHAYGTPWRPEASITETLETHPRGWYADWHA